jgi:F1F0 ATPase subunit 2
MEVIVAVMGSLVAGAVMGYLFFWGLWKTVELMDVVKHPYVWMLGSFVIRTALVLAGFYLLLQIQWQLIAVALLGFLGARMIVMQYVKRQSKLMS